MKVRGFLSWLTGFGGVLLVPIQNTQHNHRRLVENPRTGLAQVVCGRAKIPVIWLLDESKIIRNQWIILGIGDRW